MEQGFPVKSDSFMLGLDVLYDEFNDVSFYVEDEDQENLYHEVFKKLFDGVKITKIFPLNGKGNVVDDAKLNVGDRKKIYVVDKDFDDLHGQIENIENLFYLNSYSIENYLFEDEAIHAVVIEEKPKLNKGVVCQTYKYANEAKYYVSLLKELTTCYYIIQKYRLGIKNVKNAVERFVDFRGNQISLKYAEITAYKAEISTKLTAKDGRLKLNSQIKKHIKHFKNCNNIPGKYLLRMVKARLQALFKVNIEDDSLSYRLAKNCQLRSLLYLSAEIRRYAFP